MNSGTKYYGICIGDNIKNDVHIELDEKINFIYMIIEYKILLITLFFYFFIYDNYSNNNSNFLDKQYIYK